jgi:hypothetical protein
LKIARHFNAGTGCNSVESWRDGWNENPFQPSRWDSFVLSQNPVLKRRAIFKVSRRGNLFVIVQNEIEPRSAANETCLGRGCA